MTTRRTRIMVVDDDLSIRVTLEAILQDVGYEVVVADGGYEAIELAQSAPSDLVSGA